MKRPLYWLLAAGLFLLGAGPLPAVESELAPLADRALLLDGQRVGEHLVAVGERGHILVSTDAGRSWRQSPAPTRVTLTSVFFIDARRGWAAGHDATILRTLDGGTTWQIVHADPDLAAPVLDLWFRDAQYGLAVGAYGLVLVTTDGGTTWRQKPLSVRGGTQELDLHLNQLQATPAGQLYLAGESGHLYRSTDSGRNWEPLPVPYAGSLFGTLALDERRLLAFGLRGHLFYSDDAGRSWQRVETGTDATLNDAILLHDGRVLVTGLAGILLWSSHDLTRFTLEPQTDRAGFARVLQAPDGALVLLGNHGARRQELSATGGTR